MNMTPEMIDAAVINLKMLFEHSENIPSEVRDAGSKFVEALNKWSTALKAQATAQVAGS